jgi:hypothetical protein
MRKLTIAISCFVLAGSLSAAGVKPVAGPAKERTQPCVVHGYHDHLMFFCSEKVIREREQCDPDIFDSSKVICYSVTPLNDEDIRAIAGGAPVPSSERERELENCYRGAERYSLNESERTKMRGMCWQWYGGREVRKAFQP